MKRLRQQSAAAAIALLLAGLATLWLTGCMGGDDNDKGSEAALTVQADTSAAEVEPVETGVSKPPGKRMDAGDAKPPKFPAAGPPPPAAALDEDLKPPKPPKAMDEAEWKSLSKKAAASTNDTVPVIIVLKVDAVPEGQLKKEARDAQREKIADKKNAVLGQLKGTKVKNVKTFEVVPFMAAHVGTDALAELKKSPDVASVTEEKPIPLPDGPGSPNASLEPPASAPQGVSSNESLQDWWDLNQMGTTTALNNGYDGRGWNVAIADTGVQANHVGLSGKVVNQACFATGNWCPNGTSVQYGAGAAAPCTYAPANCAHGTHVAHTAAGYWGVARAAKIIAVQVFHKETTECGAGQMVCAKSWPSDQLKALEYIWNIQNSYKIAAVNFSLGGGKFGTYCDTVTDDNYGFYYWAYWLRSVGIATVVASGNDGFQDGISSPSCTSTVISVGNTTLNTSNQDAVFWKSNHDDILTVLAPGTYICSAVPYGNGWDCWWGTSMAAPHVAGAIAALKQLRYWASVPSMVTSLQSSGTPVTGPLSVSKRRIDVWQALIYLYNH
jgi:subtilisin family serine protease